MVVAFTPPQATRATITPPQATRATFTPPPATRASPLKGTASAESWGPAHGRAIVPQVPRNQRQSDAHRLATQGRQSPQAQRPGKAGSRKPAEYVHHRDDVQDVIAESQRRVITGESSITAEVQHLRKELEKERLETEKAVQHYRERIEQEQRESTRMQMILMKTQIGGSAKDEEVASVKQDVVDKTNEILEAMREMREQQQQAFKQVKSLSYAMLKACSQPTPGATGSTAAGPVSSAGSDIGRGLVFVSGTRSPARSPPRSPPSSVVESRTGNPLHLMPSPPGSLVGGRPSSPPGSLVGGRRRSPSEAGGRQRSPSLRTVPESDGVRRLPSQAQHSPSPSEDGQGSRWFKQMQANLEQFGDVEVFSEEKPQECMCCNQQIMSNYRVRPRKCNHVFHIECLLHWWSEGTCPVCHVSFAPEEAAPEARLTERSNSTAAARRQTQHWRRRSPASNVSRSPSQPKSTVPPPDAVLASLRASQSMEAFPQAASPPVLRSTSQQSNPL